MKNKELPERKIKLQKQGPEDPRETTGSSEESDSECKLKFAPNQLLHLQLKFAPNQLLHLHQTLPI